MPSGDLKFIIFYIVFTALILAFTGLMDVSALDITEMPESLKEPTLNIFTILPKFYFLIIVSAMPEFWFLGIFMTALNMAMLYIVVKALPFT